MKTTLPQARFTLPLQVERDGEIIVGTAYSDGFDVWVVLHGETGEISASGPHCMYLARYPFMRRVSEDGQWLDRGLILVESLLLQCHSRQRETQRTTR
jgi:hypothetical protein